MEPSLSTYPPMNKHTYQMKIQVRRYICKSFMKELRKSDKQKMCFCFSVRQYTNNDTQINCVKLNLQHLGCKEKKITERESLKPIFQWNQNSLYLLCRGFPLDLNGKLHYQRETTLSIGVVNHFTHSPPHQTTRSRAFLCSIGGCNWSTKHRV